MKYLVLLCDGLADRPIPSLQGKTIIESAKIPNIHNLAKGGVCGFIKTVPEGMLPGSDVCNLSVFGYDPHKYYTGRSPLEAVSMGLPLGENDLAVRCNLVTIGKNNIMQSFSANHIKNNQAKNAIDKLNRLFEGRNVEFYQGVSYRNLIIIRDIKNINVKTTPPHDISDKVIDSYLPKGEGSDMLKSIMKEASQVFDGKSDMGEANAIWLWGEGRKPSMPSFKDMYGLSGSVISAVDLVRGIGACAGLDVIKVPNVTGFLDTNFEGKAEYAIKSLETKDYVFVHVEAPDEAGHMGSIEKKIQAIELIDSRMLPIIKKGLEEFKDYRILLTPDHATPVELKTHSSEHIPAIIYGMGVIADSNTKYSEHIKPSFDIMDGYKIADYFFNYK